MDIQSSDGRNLLLIYVSSYVAKMKDHQVLKGLSLDKTGFIQHNYYIIDNKIVKDSFTYYFSYGRALACFPLNSLTVIQLVLS